MADLRMQRLLRQRNALWPHKRPARNKEYLNLDGKYSAFEYWLYTHQNTIRSFRLSHQDNRPNHLEVTVLI